MSFPPRNPSLDPKFGLRARPVPSSDGTLKLAAALEPGDDFWPDLRVRLSPDQHSEMLQTNPNLSRIFNDTHVPYRHRVNTRLDRGQRGYFVGHVYDCEDGD